MSTFFLRARSVEQVIPRFTFTGAAAALQKLRAVRFLKHRNREEVDAAPVDLDLPLESDEVSWLLISPWVVSPWVEGGGKVYLLVFHDLEGLGGVSPPCAWNGGFPRVTLVTSCIFSELYTKFK